MTAEVTPMARRTWSQLEGRDFDAVYDVIMMLDDADDWRLFRPIASFGSGPSTIAVFETHTALLVVVDQDARQIFAIGRPNL